ncbi:MAG: sucrase ferredoxin [Actinomycetota bacterium]|nr:sucrase ferredoxin [Actinomycetota bacterium]
MFATASPVRRWLLVEVRGPWGRDCIADTDLGVHVSTQWRRRLERAGVRIVAVRRSASRDDQQSCALVYACSGHAEDPRSRAFGRTIDSLADTESATSDVPIDLDIDLDLDAAAPDGWEEIAHPIVLVCTNGKHDSCCATFGRPVIRAMRDSPWRDHVWESSHVGGDRFAANVVVLPEGLYYGRVEPEQSVELLEGHAAGRIDLDHYRGRSTFGFGEQAAEYFVRRDLGLDGVDDVRAVLIDREHHEFDVTVAAAEGRSVETFGVSMRRVMTPSPTPLTCNGPDGVSYPVYQLVELRRTDA